MPPFLVLCLIVCVTFWFEMLKLKLFFLFQNKQKRDMAWWQSTCPSMQETLVPSPALQKERKRLWPSSNIPSESTLKTDGNIVRAARVSRVRVPSPGQPGDCTFLMEECTLPYHRKLPLPQRALTNESILILCENYLASQNSAAGQFFTHFPFMSSLLTAKFTRVRMWDMVDFLRHLCTSWTEGLK